MKTEDVDKIVQSIKDSVEVSEDVEKDMEDGKVTWLEGGVLAIKHGGKAVRFFVSAKEIGQELADMDEEEAATVMDEIIKGYGENDPEAMDGAKDIVMGSARVRTGIVKLVELKKRRKTEEAAGDAV